MAENTPSKLQEATGGKKKLEPYSHVLLLADGSQVRWSADDANPHAPVPTDVEGVPVVNVVHAYERSENE